MKQQPHGFKAIQIQLINKIVYKNQKRWESAKGEYLKNAK